MQYKGALWILGAFYTSPTLGISILLSNYAIKSLVESRHTNNSHPHYLFLSLSKLQRQSCLPSQTH